MTSRQAVDRILEEVAKYEEWDSKWYGPYVGLRSDNKKYRAGDYLPDSRVWDDGWVTEETLSGTSVIGLMDGYTRGYKDVTRKQAEQAVKLIAGYPWKYVYLVAGESMSWGEDQEEWVLRSARVIARII